MTWVRVRVNPLTWYRLPLEPPAHTVRALESCWHAGEGLPCCPVTSRGSSVTARRSERSCWRRVQIKARYQVRANPLLQLPVFEYWFGRFAITHKIVGSIPASATFPSAVCDRAPVTLDLRMYIYKYIYMYVCINVCIYMRICIYTVVHQWLLIS